jgi:hypothetical protein
LRASGSIIWFFIGVNRAAAGRFFSAKHGVDDGGCTTYPRPYMQSFDWAVLGTGTAFHASVSAYHFNLTVRQTQDSMGTDQSTHPASDTFFLFKP